MDENTPNDIKQEKIQEETKVYTQKEVKLKIYKTIELCLLFILAITIFFTISTLMLYKKFNTYLDKLNFEDYIKYKAVIDIYKKEYINDFDDKKAMDYALTAIVVSSEDKYGSYIPSEEYDFKSSRIKTGDYKGIGVTISLNEEENGIDIIKVVKNSPAGRAGLQEGQVITKINDIEINKETYNEALKEIRNESIENIQLEINGTETYILQLGNVIVDKVTYEIKDNIGYIKIHTFLGNTLEEFKKAIDKVTTQNIKKIVFDLRDNTGGDAEIIAPILDYIIDNGLIVSLEYKNGDKNIITANEISKLPKDIPIYLLANNSTASASELFIMSLQDHFNAKLIGQQTFGKNTILTIHTLADKSLLIVSSGFYYTDSHRDIEGIGIPPDIELTDEEIELDWTELTQYYN